MPRFVLSPNQIGSFEGNAIEKAIEETKSVCMTHWRHGPIEINLMFGRSWYVFSTLHHHFIIILSEKLETIKGIFRSPTVSFLFEKAIQIWATELDVLHFLSSNKTIQNKLFFIPFQLSPSLTFSSSSSSSSSSSFLSSRALSQSLPNQRVLSSSPHKVSSQTTSVPLLHKTFSESICFALSFVNENLIVTKSQSGWNKKQDLWHSFSLNFLFGLRRKRRKWNLFEINTSHLWVCFFFCENVVS